MIQRQKIGTAFAFTEQRARANARVTFESEIVKFAVTDDATMAIESIAKPHPYGLSAIQIARVSGWRSRKNASPFSRPRMNSVVESPSASMALFGWTTVTE